MGVALMICMSTPAASRSASRALVSQHGRVTGRKSTSPDMSMASHFRPYPNVPLGNSPVCLMDGQESPPWVEAKHGHEAGRKWECMSMVGTRVSGRDHDRRCRDRVGARASARALISRHCKAIDVIRWTDDSGPPAAPIEGP